jgi:trigger factor
MNLKSTTKVDTNKYELEIEVPADDFNAAVNAAYRKEVKNLNIPGFRKGKAPKAVCEKMYGEGIFFDAAIDNLYRPAVIEAIDASNLEVVAVKEMDIVETSKENGFIFKQNVIVKPEVSIDGYKGIEVTKHVAPVTDEDIDEEIKKVQDRNSRMVNVEDRAAYTGDTAVIDFEGFVDGVAFEGGKAENYELSLGAGQFIPGFEDQIVGHEIGEEFDITVTFPEDYQAEELKGKEAVFKIKLHELKAKELPEIDDEFVKDVSDYDTLDEYKASIKTDLENKREEAGKTEVDNQIIDTLIEKLEGEIPEEMYENEIDESVNNFAYRLQSQGLDIQTYFKYTGLTAETIREQFKDQAEKNVKVRLALEKIVALEGIDASDEDVENEFKKLAETYEMDIEEVKKVVDPKQLKADITNEKAVTFVRDNAVVKTEE